MEKTIQNRRRYYSQRTGRRNAIVELNAIRKIFLSIYREFERKQYFDEYFGKWCPDEPNCLEAGKAGEDVRAYVMRKVRKDNLWPIEEKCTQYSEEDLFDMIEFLFDHISRPLEKDARYHSWDNCGYHYKYFDARIAKMEFVTEVNEFLNDYGEGYELNSNGEIYALLREEFRPLLEASLPTNNPENVENKIRMAIDKFRRYGSTLDERREAVRSLADCLEFLRSDLKNVLTGKDDDDLFNIANNFGIRHHNDKQKTNYEHAVWLSWMFYFYLATLHVGLRLIEKRKSRNHELQIED